MLKDCIIQNKNTNGKSVSRASVFVNQSTGCLPINMNNKGKIGKSGRETHTMATKPRVSKEIKAIEENPVMGSNKKIRETQIELTHTLYINNEKDTDVNTTTLRDGPEEGFYTRWWTEKWRRHESGDVCRTV